MSTVLLKWKIVADEVKKNSGKFIKTPKGDIIGDPFIIDVIKKKSRNSKPFLLLGEKASGKNAVAHLIHLYSNRKAARFLDANLDGSEDELNENYFGTAKKQAAIEEYNGGTIHFDLIEYLVNKPDKYLQNLINLSYHGLYQRYDNAPVDVDIRIICGTTLDLKGFIQLTKRSPKFEYLYTMLDKFGTVSLPPLREIVRKKTDGLERLLAEKLASLYLSKEYSQAEVRRIEKISDGTLTELKTFIWPHNFSDLHSLVQAALTHIDWEQAVNEKRELLNAPIFRKPLLLLNEYKYDLFISYSSRNSSEAKQIEATAKRKGLRAYLAAKDISFGEEWQENVRNALINSREVCVLVTPDSLKSEWVLTEWGAAWALKKTITPIILDCSVEQLPERLRQRQIARFHELSIFLNSVLSRQSL